MPDTDPAINVSRRTAVRRETLIAGSVSGNYVFPIEIQYDQMVDIDHESEFIDSR